MDPGADESSASEAPDLALAKLRLQVEELDLPTPEISLRIRFQVRNNQLALVAQADISEADALDAWTEQIDFDRAFSRRSGNLIHRWLVFEPIPKQWTDVLSLFELRLAAVEPSGEAEVVLHGTREDIRSFIGEAASQDIELVSIQGFSPDYPDFLSPEQEAAVRAALREGYYRVPRELSLTELSEKLGISVSALSERLRRAEAQVMALYLGEMPVAEGVEKPDNLAPDTDRPSPL